MNSISAVGDTEFIASKNNKWSRYFRTVVLLGVTMNLVVGIPALFVPGTILSWIGLPPEVTEFWVRLACWLLILLSLTYIPAAIDPHRSPAHSCGKVGRSIFRYSDGCGPRFESSLLVFRPWRPDIRDTRIDYLNAGFQGHRK